MPQWTDLNDDIEALKHLVDNLLPNPLITGIVNLINGEAKEESKVDLQQEARTLDYASAVAKLQMLLQKYTPIFEQIQGAYMSSDLPFIVN